MNDLKPTTLLDKLSFPEGLKDLSTDDLELLASEIRQRLLEIGDACGGHLASNLGVVELTIVLHSLLNSPTDKMVFDTSHQTYVHKMLTGRLKDMFSIRQDGGLSGFAKIDESEHDTFGAGHASTALSAALGVAEARDLKEEDYTVVSVIGDASLSGGMAFEALNNIQNINTNFICILNDNNMSISNPVGSMAEYITKVRTSPLYDQAKQTFDAVVERIPKIGEPLKRRVEKAVDHFRDLIIDSKAGVLFEEFGFKYLGPIDGHNIEMLMAAMKYAKSYQGPIMIHIITQKGKGCEKAEADPTTYHGVSPKPKTQPTTPANPNLSYTKVFGRTMTELCATHKDIAVITPAMKEGSGLVEFAKTHPKQFFDVGIAEEHAVTFAAGLARAGVIPVLAIYSTFLQRGYDQMIHDVCLQKLPVIFALDRAGLVGPDGPTHHGVLDYNYMLPIPHLNILAPKDGVELEMLLKWAVKQKIATSIRYPKAGMSEHNGDIQTPMENQLLECLYDSHPEKDLDVLLIGMGSTAWPAYDAAQVLKGQDISSAVINLRLIKPLDTNFLTPYIQRAKKVVVVEEGQGIGGVFHYILNQYKNSDKALSDWHSLSLPDEFVTHGAIKTLHQAYQLDTNGIINTVTELLSPSASALESSHSIKNLT